MSVELGETDGRVDDAVGVVGQIEGATEVGVEGRSVRARVPNGAQAIPAILALAATSPIVTGRFDLSIGFGIGLAHVVAMWLIAEHAIAWPVVVDLYEFDQRSQAADIPMAIPQAIIPLGLAITAFLVLVRFVRQLGGAAPVRGDGAGGKAGDGAGHH